MADDKDQPTEAVAFVREHYDPRAVETPWQRRYIERLSSRLITDARDLVYQVP